MSQAVVLKPWTRVAVPHDDILRGDFDLSSYAANLGQVDVDAPGCPRVYRDPVAFFRATYMTGALSDLLRGVGDALSGGAGNRVLQLRTPFGGGKTHTLIALLHLFRHRDALRAAGELVGLPDPGPVTVAVIPCLDLDAAAGREVDGVRVRTLWGELAVRIGGRAAYEHVRAADEGRINPGGDALRRVLGDRPVLVLLDEVLTYVEAAMGVTVGQDTNLGRQTMAFLQYLTEVVRGLPHAAMVYSLQQSVREALGDEGLLQTLDSLVSRVDAKKEPVTGDEVLQVVRRRLFKEVGDPYVHAAVAREYGLLARSFLGGNAHTEGEKRAAEDQAEQLERRVKEAYPFHPELLDLMYHRWGSLPTYQRTRGALQFLATTIGALWKQGDAAGPLIGPGEVALDDAMVRNTFFSQVGEREQMKSVLDSDLIGPGARCLRVDKELLASAPALQAFRPAVRLTRAITLYSFGAKAGEDRGVLRSDLLAAVQCPGLTADVLDVALQGLSDTLLYIHATGRRFRFERRPNLNKLVDDEARKPEIGEVDQVVKKELETRLGAADGFVAWPKDSEKVPDRVPRFQVVFLGPAHALRTPDEVSALARTWTDRRGDQKRQYRNALVFAVPAAAALDDARKAARKVVAVDRLIADKTRHAFGAEDLSDLRSRRERAATDLQAAVRRLYPQLLLPVAAPPTDPDPMRIERFDVPEWSALGGGLLASVYKALEIWVSPKATPKKLVTCTHLGEGDGEAGGKLPFVRGPDVVDWFFGSVQFPKLLTLDGLKETVAQGVSSGLFGYVMGATEADGKLKLDGRDSLTFHEPMERGDVDLTAGSWLVSAVVAERLREEWRPKPVDPPIEPPIEPPIIDPPIIDPPIEPPIIEPPVVTERHEVRLEFRADRKQLFAAFTALQGLSDWADAEFVASVHIYAKGTRPLDPHAYEMNVLLALDEEGVVVVKK